jgi:hypothetical protein
MGQTNAARQQPLNLNLQNLFLWFSQTIHKFLSKIEKRAMPGFSPNGYQNRERQRLGENFGCSAPKARNVIAQGNALGKGHFHLGSAAGAK